MDYKPNTIKFKAFLNRADNGDEDSVKESRYNLSDIENPKGWKFNEIDTLGDMGFIINSEDEMTCEVELQNLEEDSKKVNIKAYKTNEGYVLETNRKYVFETFKKMLEYIDSTPSLNA